MKPVIKFMLIRLLQAYAALIVAFVVVHFTIDRKNEMVFDFRIILLMPTIGFLIGLLINYYNYKKHSKN